MIPSHFDPTQTWRPSSAHGEQTAWPVEQPVAGVRLPDRYEDLGLIGVGGMGQVRRVRDRHLERVLAMKITAAAGSDMHKQRARFVQEARINARLDHPSIVAVHDQGELADGRLWFTMREVRGVTLRAVMKDLHSGQTSLRRLLSVFEQVCQALASAHEQLVVHRDLKPDNVMVGPFGEVQVMDWGLAISPAVRPEPGQLAGTPLYMAPEQAAGQDEHFAPCTDVWALGAMLFEALTERRLWPGSLNQVLRAARTQEPPQVNDCLAPDRTPPPSEMVALVSWCLSRDPGARPAHAGIVGERVRAWLDGEAARQRALLVVQRADAVWPDVARLRARAREQQAQAAAMEDSIEGWRPVDDKRQMWALEDSAEAARMEADRVEVDYERQLYAALEIAEGLPEATDRLGDLYRTQLIEAEAASDARAARRAAQRLVSTGRHRSWLEAGGAVTLHTDRPAHVSVFPWIERDRRLVPGPERDLGTTPLRAVELPRGSHVLLLRTDDLPQPVRLPVRLGREEHWDHRPPGEGSTRVLRLPRPGELSADEVLIPGGWAILGGDAEAVDSLSRRRVWIDAFVLARTPVTARQYADFLEDLLRNGVSEHEVYQPMDLSSAGGAEGRTPMFVREGDSYGLPERSVRPWTWDRPISHVDWWGARACAAWMGGRLPADLEWEKAARGVDGRSFVWGTHFDASWVNAVRSHRGTPSMASVRETPDDVGPYGILGMAGNVRDWCLDRYERQGQAADGQVLAVCEPPLDDPAPRACRGGAFSSTDLQCRAAGRYGAPPTYRYATLGFRVARDWPPR